jgi:hypothetical protein
LLEGSEEVAREDLWKAIYGKEPVLVLEWLLAAEYNDVILIGQPDSVLFENEFPLVFLSKNFLKV